MIRILFVDDEPRVLDGLRRTLRPMRDKWEMSFVDGGKKALERLAEQSFDVLVTDMQMPEVDGRALLSAASGKYPEMSRIVLSGQSSAEAEVRANGLAHSYLTKPCGMQDLTLVVDRLLPA